MDGASYGYYISGDSGYPCNSLPKLPCPCPGPEIGLGKQYGDQPQQAQPHESESLYCANGPSGRVQFLQNVGDGWRTVQQGQHNEDP